jgi:hypothetical protein
MKRNKSLKGCSLVEVLERLEQGHIGHQAAMDWLHIESLNELADIMSANGRVMPGYQDMEVAPETRAAPPDHQAVAGAGRGWLGRGSIRRSHYPNIFPASPFAIKSRVSFTPNSAMNEPKRGPCDWPSSTS